MDRGAWWATVHKVAKSQTHLKQLSTHASHTISSHDCIITYLLDMYCWTLNVLLNIKVVSTISLLKQTFYEYTSK